MRKTIFLLAALLTFSFNWAEETTSQPQDIITPGGRRVSCSSLRNYYAA
jgi:hypothetical protein